MLRDLDQQMLLQFAHHQLRLRLPSQVGLQNRIETGTYCNDRGCLREPLQPTCARNATLVFCQYLSSSSGISKVSSDIRQSPYCKGFGDYLVVQSERRLLSKTFLRQSP